MFALEVLSLRLLQGEVSVVFLSRSRGRPEPEIDNCRESRGQRADGDIDDLNDEIVLIVGRLAPVQPDKHKQEGEEPGDHQIGDRGRGPGDRAVGRRQGLKPAARALRIGERILRLLARIRVLSLGRLDGEFSELLSNRSFCGGIGGELRLRFTRVRRSDSIRNNFADLVGELTCLVARNQLDDVRRQPHGDANQRVHLPLPCHGPDMR